MADKGTRVRDLVKELHGQYICPSSLKDGLVMLVDAEKNEEIAQARVHVERAIGRVKRFRILTGTLPHKPMPKIDDILFVCVWASIYQPYDDMAKPRAS